MVCFDYVENQPCFLCGRNLTAGRARRVEFPDGVQDFAGPTCAWVHADNPNKKIPDLTKFLREAREQGAVEPSSAPKTLTGPSEPKDPTMAKRADLEAYLRLRYERLLGIYGMDAMPFLTKAYEALRKGELDDMEIPSLWKAIRTIEGRRPALGLRSLKDLYFMWHWLNKCLATLDDEGKREFIQACLDSLREEWTLSKGKMAGALRFLEYLPGAPRIGALNLPGRSAKGETSASA